MYIHQRWPRRKIERDEGGTERERKREAHAREMQREDLLELIGEGVEAFVWSFSSSLFQDLSVFLCFS